MNTGPETPEPIDGQPHPALEPPHPPGHTFAGSPIGNLLAIPVPSSQAGIDAPHDGDLRAAAHELVTASCERQGVPLCVTDAAVVTKVAALLTQRGS